MKVCRKVLSVILAVVIALGTFAVAVSANGNPDTATYQSKWWLTASKATINWTSDSRVTINDSEDEQTGVIEVEPGDTYYIYLYVTNNYYTGNMSTHVFYSADLLDCTDVYLQQRPKKTSMTQANVNKVFLWNSGDNVEYLSACSASNSVRGAWGNFADSVKVDDICWPQDASGNVTLNKNEWKFTRIGNQPDPGVSEETFELSDDSAFLVKFPLTIPADATAGKEYTVMIPEGIIRDSAHKFAWMYLNSYPDGEVPAPSGNPQYYDDDQYFDLSEATLTFKVPGQAETLDYSALQTLYDQVKDTVTDNYTDASVAAFNTALQNAKAMLDAQNAADQAAIDSIASALDTAYKGLTEKGASYAALDNALAAAAALNENDYTADSWAALASAVTAGNAVSRDLKVSDQATVDAATKAITDAIAGLAEADADYTALNEALADAAMYIESSFTADSWANLKSAVEAGQAVPQGLKISDQKTIDDAAAAIRNALEALVPADADYTALDAAIAQAEALNADIYTAESYAAVADALAAAKAVARDLKISNQDVIDNAAAALNNAIAALVEKDANYEALNEALADAAMYIEDSFTPDSWAVLKSAVEAGEAVPQGLKISDQAVIDNAVAAIREALEGLVPVDADYTALDAAIAQAEALNADAYTAESYAAVANALAEAKAVARDLKITNQYVIDNAAAALNNAIAALVVKPEGADYSALDAAVAQAEALNADVYTAESYAAVADALAAAKAVARDLTENDQGIIDTAAAALNDAIAALVEKDADYTALNEALTDAAMYIEDSFTADSWANLKSAVEAGQAVPQGLKISDQKTIDDATAAIRAALEALVPADADYTALDAAIATAEALNADDYTAESYAAVADALAAAKAVARDLKISNQYVIDDAAAALNRAIEGLVEEPAADYQALTNALAAAAQYDENNYTAESWAALKSAVEAGEAVPANLKARDQKTIDDAADAINAAIAGLVAKEIKSTITSVTYTPSESETNTFTVTVNGRPSKVRFIGPDGGTMTFDRYSSKVAIKSYTADGQECTSVSKDIAYEVWEITDKIADGTDIKAVAKVGSTWETESYNFTVNTAAPEKDYTVYSAELASTEGTDNKVTATVKTGLDVTKIRFTMKDGGSVTLDAANYATEVGGQLVFTYDVYTGFAGENTIKVDVKAGSTWVDGTTLTYNHAEAVAE